MYNDDEKDKKKKKSSFNIDAFKHAIGMIESSGGKYLDNSTSDAAGKYHFIYNLIKGDKDMKGVSKRDFINNPKLQEKIMDKALRGELKGYVSYPKWASKLKSDFNSNLSIEEIAALTHFMGAGGARSYLRNPETHKVPGVNATAEQYLERYRKYSDAVRKDTDVLKKDLDPIVQPSQRFVSENAKNAMQVPKDGTSVRQPQMRKNLSMQQSSEPQFLKNKTIDTRGLTDATSNQEADTGIIPLNEQVEGGTPSAAKFLTEMVNQNAMGGRVSQTMDPTQPQVIEYNEGGTHEENIHGGVPVGMGANGKMNTVEEGETKFNDYVFSNRFGLGGKIETNNYKCGGKTNKYEDGGNINSVDPVDPEGPKEKQSTTITKTFTNLDTAAKTKKSYEIPKAEVQFPYTNAYSKHMAPSSTPEGKMQSKFVEWYDNPETRRRIEAQGEMTPQQIQDFLAHGVKGDIKKGTPSVAGADAQFYPEDNSIIMSDMNDLNTGTHEILHRSGFDQTLSAPLMKILGNSFQQDEKNNFKSFKRYLNQPHEAYGNFHELRTRLGLKPGQKVTKDQLKKMVKDKGLENDNFYKTFDDEKITKAINTVASNSKPQTITEYRLA